MANETVNQLEPQYVHQQLQFELYHNATVQTVVSETDQVTSMKCAK